MDILKATTEEEARALERKAFAWAVANQGAKGAQWSEVHTDGTAFGVTFDPSIQPAFSKAETGETIPKGSDTPTLSKVQSVQTKVTDSGGKTTGAWEVKPAPVPVTKDAPPAQK